MDSRRKYEFFSTSIDVTDEGRSAIADGITTVSVDVLTESERPSENPESWRGGGREGRSRGDSVMLAREGTSAERGNAGVIGGRRISGKLFFAANRGRGDLEAAA